MGMMATGMNARRQAERGLSLLLVDEMAGRKRDDQIAMIIDDSGPAQAAYTRKDRCR
jgi:hypothetical protein